MKKILKISIILIVPLIGFVAYLYAVNPLVKDFKEFPALFYIIMQTILAYFILILKKHRWVIIIIQICLLIILCIHYYNLKGFDFDPGKILEGSYK